MRGTTGLLAETIMIEKQIDNSIKANADRFQGINLSGEGEHGAIKVKTQQKWFMF